MTEPRWRDMTVEEYHGLPAISSGGLRCFEKFGPLEYHAQYVAKTKASVESTARRMGTCFHSAMEDPDNWEAGYEVVPEVAQDQELVESVKSTVDSKSKAEPPQWGVVLNLKKPLHRRYMSLVEEKAKSCGKILLTEEQHATIDLQISAVYDNPACREYVGQKNSGNVEMACVRECPVTGMPMKALVDLLTGDTVVDFKTDMSLNPDETIRNAEKHGYIFQAAHYLYVTGRPEHRFITVTSEASLRTGSHCEANLWHVVPADLVYAHDKNMAVLEQLKSLDLMGAFSSDEVDSQGVGLVWHNKGYAADLPLNRLEFSGEGR